MSPHPLQPLALHIKEAEPGNSERLEFLQHEILDKGASPETLGDCITGLLGGAVSLVRALEDLPSAPRQEVSKMVLRLVQLARNRYERDLLAAEAEGAQAAPLPPEPRELPARDPAENLNAMELGDMLVQLGFLSEVKRDEARAHASRLAGTEEAALLELGFTTVEDLKRARDLQAMLGKAQPKSDSQAVSVRPSLLGEILVACGRIERADLNAALAVQAKDGGLLGNVLVDLAAVSWDDVAHALREQGKLSRSA